MWDDRVFECLNKKKIPNWDNRKQGHDIVYYYLWSDFELQHQERFFTPGTVRYRCAVGGRTKIHNLAFCVNNNVCFVKVVTHTKIF